MTPTRLAILITLLAVVIMTTACGPGTSLTSPIAPTVHLETPPPSTTPAGNLSEQAIASLRSLQQVDDYPLYTMHILGEYAFKQPDPSKASAAPLVFNPPHTSSQTVWGCSLFAALAEGGSRLYGRNFDWEFSPALLLFTHPPDGYASLSMVDIAYLGFSGQQAWGLTERSLEELQSLLDAPAWPFDGMNSQGLAIGMAAVPDGEMVPDPAKPTLDSLMIIREVLDHAANIEQAVEIFRRYNIEMGGGPPLHYLVADASGEAVLVEFYRGKMRVIPNKQPYHLATNFLISAAGNSPRGQCRRYDAMQETLAAEQGGLSFTDALQLLSTVSQDITQWSIVYDLTGLEVQVIVGRQVDQIHRFDLR